MLTCVASHSHDLLTVRTRLGNTSALLSTLLAAENLLVCQEQKSWFIFVSSLNFNQRLHLAIRALSPLHDTNPKKNAVFFLMFLKEHEVWMLSHTVQMSGVWGCVDLSKLVAEYAHTRDMCEHLQSYFFPSQIWLRFRRAMVVAYSTCWSSAKEVLQARFATERVAGLFGTKDACRRHATSSWNKQDGHESGLGRIKLANHGLGHAVVLARYAG